jgi:hypothetical protein
MSQGGPPGPYDNAWQAFVSNDSLAVNNVLPLWHKFVGMFWSLPKNNDGKKENLLLVPYLKSLCIRTCSNDLQINNFLKFMAKKEGVRKLREFIMSGLATMSFSHIISVKTNRMLLRNGKISVFFLRFCSRKRHKNLSVCSLQACKNVCSRYFQLKTQ